MIVFLQLGHALSRTLFFSRVSSERRGREDTTESTDDGGGSSGGLDPRLFWGGGGGGGGGGGPATSHGVFQRSIVVKLMRWAEQSKFRWFVD